MTVITGSIESIGMAPLSGLLTARPVVFRPSGGVLYAPEAVPFPIVAGVVSADVAPGPVRLTVQVGSHARDSFDVVVPDVGPVTLASLVNEVFEWTPEQVSEFVQLRDETVAAAGAAQTAVNSFGVTASASTGAVGSAASVVVSGGPEYNLEFTVPRGDKGDTGPSAYSSMSQSEANTGTSSTARTIGANVLKAAIQTHSPPTTAADLSGALTNAVDASLAKFDYYSPITGNTVSIMVGQVGAAVMGDVGEAVGSALDDKSDVGHAHTPAEVGAVANAGNADGLWIGTEATLPSTGTTGVLYVTTD
ncbi:hypothetical protein [Dietzia alimentaria]|uniref:hypothetical protein n=1 Tax=Dietzia alimentaria TaxID=665550 RepID=UPI00029B309D|nr:hypothetical protein [Dietzia alimentaria]